MDGNKPCWTSSDLLEVWELTALFGEPQVRQEWKDFRWDAALHCAAFGHHHIFWVAAASWLICWALWARPSLILLTARKDLEVIFSSPVVSDTERTRCSAWLLWGALSVWQREPFPSSSRRDDCTDSGSRWMFANVPGGAGCLFP